MALADVISHCQNKWLAKGILLASPSSEHEVRRVWESLSKKISRDVLQLYTSVGGFHDYTLDEEFFFCLWPWNWLQERNRESPGDGVMFCDHSIEVVTWEFRYEDAETSSVWSSFGTQSAPTLESFLHRYLIDPWELL